MAVRHQIVMKRAEYELTLTLLDQRLIIYDGDAPIEQEFESVAELVEHVQRIVKLRQGDGYRVSEERTGDAIKMPPAAAPAVRKGEKWEADAKRLTQVIYEQEPLDVASAAIVARALALHARSLRLAADCDGPSGAWPAALADSPLTSVTSFVFDTPWATVTRQGRQTCGALDEVLAGLPAIERVYFCGDIQTKPLRHTKLVELILVGDPITDSVLEALAASSLPALQVLTLGLAGDDSPASADRVAAAVLGLIRGAPKLQTIRIDDADDVVTMLDRLARRTWTELWIDGTILDEDALIATLDRHAAMLSSIATVALPLEDNLSSEAVIACRKKIPSLIDLADRESPTLPSAYAAW